MNTSKVSRLVRVVVLVMVLAALVLPATAQSVPPLYTSGRTYNVSDRIVSTSVFHWYTSTGGQLSGPWMPLEGRSNWTGETEWWKSQIKQMMAANIDVLWVHTHPAFEVQRVNLFRALNQMRSSGYDVPKVAPFLDPTIIWAGQTIDVATTSGKDAFAGEYIRFFQQYFSVNQDQHADSYLEQIGGKVVLDTWHVKGNCINVGSLTRSDVETRLAVAFGATHPVFNNGIRMVTNAWNVPTLSFADEKVPQFEVSAYNAGTTFNGVTTVQLKPGFWDMNIRVPGSILKRDGGDHYRDAWNAVNRNTTSRVYIESWNEYDEGSGIYAADTGATYRVPSNTSSDTWSSTNDPYEYIRTTATGAAAFNDIPSLDAKPLWNSIPTQVRRGTMYSAKVVMRNTGDLSWNSASGVRFGQDIGADSAVFSASDCTIDDMTNEIPIYEGVYRGRPIEFTTQLTTPSTDGTYVTHWGMADSMGQVFGEQVPVTIKVSGSPVPIPATPTDEGVTTSWYEINFKWSAVTDPAGIAGYNCRIGTSPGASNVYSGYVGKVLKKRVNASSGNTYYCQVQAVAKDGAASQWSNASDGITYVPPLYSSGRTYNLSDHIVSASVFHWYTSTDGQLSGPWLPLDGRPNWTGETEWWKSQIKQMMMANIDVLWVHLIPAYEVQRVNLFRALNEMRSSGYDVPNVAPFLDPMITWDGQWIDVSTTAGKDVFAGQYIRFFEQYFSVNQDQYADSYLEQIDGKLVLDTWHVKHNLSNLASLTRSDVETRLAAAFGANHPIFNNGIRMVTNAWNVPTLSFADEKVVQFEMSAYNIVTTFNGVTAVQLKGGYWDKNVRPSGSILKRDGGGHYKDAWNAVNRNTTTRVYIESWNEYDEGSGIYAANPGPPYRVPGNNSTDTWSITNDPYEYIRTTATGAAAFNDIPSLDAKPLWNSIPTQVRRGTTYSAKAVMKNTGDLSWNSASGVRFGQDRGADTVVFSASDCTIDDMTNEIPTYEGVFRGRPIEFTAQMTTPSTDGTYVTHWGMADSTGQRFGEQAPVTIHVSGSPVPTPAAPTDDGVATRWYEINFNWSAVTDPVAGIAGYNCRIGLTPGAANVYSGFVGNLLKKRVNASNGNTYYCQVQAVANDGAVSQWSNASDGITYDITPPTAPGTPTDAGLYTEDTSITFTWTAAEDSASGVADYICRIGTSPGGSNTFNGYVGNVLSKTLTVARRQTYYCRVIGKDVAGNAANSSAESDGIGVVDFADRPVSSVKAYPNQTWIGLTLPVSATFANRFYVQDVIGPSGIGVLSSQPFQAGDMIQFYGPLATQDFERVISPVKVLAQ